MRLRHRKVLVLVGLGGLFGLYAWAATGLPGFGHYPGPYGDAIAAIAVSQTHATGVVSAVNFFYRGFDTVGEEFILFIAATGVATALRELRNERGQQEQEAVREENLPATSGAVRIGALAFVGPMVLLGWWLTTHAQTNPSGGFQGGAVTASGLLAIYLAGQFLVLKNLSPEDLTDAVEAVGAGGFVAMGFLGLLAGSAYLADVLPLGREPGAVDASGTIVWISFFVGVEVTAAFVLIAAELLEQTLLIGDGSTP